jgi:hypothetical protein
MVLVSGFMVPKVGCSSHAFGHVAADHASPSSTGRSTRGHDRSDGVRGILSRRCEGHRRTNGVGGDVLGVFSAQSKGARKPEQHGSPRPRRTSQWSRRPKASAPASLLLSAAGERQRSAAIENLDAKPSEIPRDERQHLLYTPISSDRCLWEESACPRHFFSACSCST